MARRSESTPDCARLPNHELRARREGQPLANPFRRHVGRGTGPEGLAASMGSAAGVQTMLLAACQSIFLKPIAWRPRRRKLAAAARSPEMTVLCADIILSCDDPEAVDHGIKAVGALLNSLAARFGVDRLTCPRGRFVAAASSQSHPRHAAVMADFALILQAEVMRIAPRFRGSVAVKIGLHTGPMPTRGGECSICKETLDKAGQMESSGPTGCIQTSAATYSQLGERYFFEKRGPFYIPGEGEIATYLLQGRRNICAA